VREPQYKLDPFGFAELGVSVCVTSNQTAVKTSVGTRTSCEEVLTKVTVRVFPTSEKSAEADKFPLLPIKVTADTEAVRPQTTPEAKIDSAETIKVVRDCSMITAP